MYGMRASFATPYQIEEPPKNCRRGTEGVRFGQWPLSSTFRGGPSWASPKYTTCQAAARASVGARRAARSAGYRPAIPPITTVAPTAPPRTHSGTAVGHSCAVA